MLVSTKGLSELAHHLFVKSTTSLMKALSGKEQKRLHLLFNRSLFDDWRFLFDGNAWNLQGVLLRVVPFFSHPSSHNQCSVETGCV